jgi:hypothetical protein
MIAALGAGIVFAGLAVLAGVISQIPKIFGIFERLTASKTSPAATSQPPTKMTTATATTENIVIQIRPLAAKLPEPFQLAELYRLCRDHDVPHPHLSLCRLQQKGILHPEGGGAFTWKSEAAGTQEG